MKKLRAKKSDLLVAFYNRDDLLDTGSVKQGVLEVDRVLELVPSPPAEIMHPASSSEKHFSSEKTYHEGGAESQVLTKMTSTVTHSSTTSTKKEFSSSTMASTLSQSGHEPSSVCTKTSVQSSEQSISENGAPPVVQVSTRNTSVLSHRESSSPRLGLIAFVVIERIATRV